VLDLHLTEEQYIHSLMSKAFPESLQKSIEEVGIVAVLIIDDAKQAVPLARALLQGGVRSIELTLRTPAAMDALRAIRQEVPEMMAGVGTVLRPEQIESIVEAGAAFAVSPGLNPRVLAAARDAGLPFAPGIATPSDIECAVEHGCSLLKFFPAEPSGGLNFLRAIAAPYAHLGLRYIPLGGVNEDNLASYSSDPLIAAIGGSWLAPKALVQSSDWPGITALAGRAVETIAAARAK
jgi:2-dehydro-3-deoxyphosphogluconate aldolase / (4S)-4-hydroxy-2-oxoglutarate aldolase